MRTAIEYEPQFDSLNNVYLLIKKEITEYKLPSDLESREKINKRRSEFKSKQGHYFVVDHIISPNANIVPYYKIKEEIHTIVKPGSELTIKQNIEK
jgi:hypothetical protein